MKILYLSSLVFPSTTASAYQIKSMSRAFFGQLGNNFCLAVSRAEAGSLPGLNYWATNYRHKRLRSLYYFWLFLKNRLPFALNSELLVYTKDPQLIVIANFFKLFYGYKTCFELHIPWAWRINWIVWNTDYFVVINRYLKRYLIEKRGRREKQIVVFPDAVNLADFQITDDKNECRKKVFLTAYGFWAGYVGRFKTGGKEKGIKTIIEAIPLVRPEINFCFVGGTTEEINEYQQLAKKLGCLGRCLFVPYQPNNLIPYYLKAMDCLLMPFPRAEHYEFYMSPLKLFEYLAAGRPIIASDLPAIREILNEQNAFLVAPDDVPALAKKVEKIFSSPALAEALGRQAVQESGQYTWDKRALVILNFFKNNLSNYED